MKGKLQQKQMLATLAQVPVHPVMPQLQRPSACFRLDFSPNNKGLMNIDIADTDLFDRYVFGQMMPEGKEAGVGGYGEWREIYRRSRLFDGTSGEEPRCIHLGVDIWAPAHTPVWAPLDGVVHSAVDNAGYGNYGGTVILRHQIDGVVLYSLYGHLATGPLKGLSEGQEVKAGEEIGCLGAPAENGHWPPHLHFQLMLDLLGNTDDFPGVCTRAEQEMFLTICPNPNLLLRLPVLD